MHFSNLLHGEVTTFVNAAHRHLTRRSVLVKQVHVQVKPYSAGFLAYTTIPIYPSFEPARRQLDNWRFLLFYRFIAMIALFLLF